MFRNYLTIAFRSILHQKAYNLLNLAGLAIGITCGLIMALHVQEELSYEKDFPGYDNIYRVHVKEWAKSSPVLAEEIEKFMPEIEAIGRFAYAGTPIVGYQKNNAAESTGYYADAEVLKVFGLKLLQGKSDQLLTVPNTIVLTQRMAQRYFGKKDPVGEVLNFDNSTEYTVVGVMEDLPKNSHLKFDFLVSMPTFYKQLPPDLLTNRGWMVMYTYAKFASASQKTKAQEKMPAFIGHHYADWDNKEQMIAEGALAFQPVTDIHLKSNLEQEMGANSSIAYIYILVAVQILVLVIACVNFMNLFTTQTIKRLKEVGMRKILGANKSQLVLQFLTEAFILALSSVVLAIVLYQFALPVYNSITSKNLTWDVLFTADNILLLISIMLFVWLFSGLYPALFISGIEPVSSLKATKTPRSFPVVIRKSLVVFQFAVSLFLITGTIFISQQMHLLRNKEMGFDKNQVVYIKLYGDLYKSMVEKPQTFKSEFLRNPNVLTVATTSNYIGDDLSVEGITPQGTNGQEFPSVRVMRTDGNYLKTLSIPVIAGRDFSTDFNDSASVIINEQAVKDLRLENPIGTVLQGLVGNRTAKVIGVAKDFHFTSLHNTIEPLIIEYRPEFTGSLVVKMQAGKTKETLAYLRKATQTIAPGSLFVYNFLDEKLNELYKTEDSLSTILQIFSVLAIIIACLGLFGLAAHSIETRTKEIGIRKVLGATVTCIVALFSKDFIKLIGIGFIIAIPLTLYAIQQWLQNFAYQIDIQWWVFALSGLLVLVIALLTISFQSIKAALANPIKSLRNE
ncbi:ABC transporter permease [Rhodocytophaga aerolata]|uniref:ABC transporter permease n=1 Tax=Rhodocytophaga aerolata TaxID=455078 RepID=A0ABT8R9D1_9BACT|nr:ABC transporter permease [Rhodocytophaga aerolata]MDO1447372.1 ABC transporter permease [Rhodocytophaga aerolata]